MQAKLLTIKNALVALTSKCYHYHAPSKTAPTYIVWAEDGLDNLHGDNKACEGIIQGTVDIYSKTEFDTLFDGVSSALEGIGCSVELNSVQYEEDTGIIHYEWRWEYA